MKLLQRNLNRAVSAAHQVYGASSCHVHYGMTLPWVGGLFAEQGDFEGAHGQLTRATAMLKACLTPCHDASAVASDRTASVLAAQGEFAGAQEAALGALQMKQKLYGSIPSPSRGLTAADGRNLGGHYEITASLYWLGVCCRLQGDTDSALHHLGEALALQLRIYGSESAHPDIIRTITATAETGRTCLILNFKGALVSIIILMKSSIGWNTRVKCMRIGTDVY